LSKHNSTNNPKIKAMHVIVCSFLTTALSYLMRDSLPFVMMYYIILMPISLIILPIWWCLILANIRDFSRLAFVFYILFSGPFLLSALMIVYYSGVNRIHGNIIAKYMEFRPTPDYVVERNIPDFVSDHHHLTIVVKNHTSKLEGRKLITALLVNTPLKKVTLRDNALLQGRTQTYEIEIGEICNKKSNGNFYIQSLQNYGYRNKCIRVESDSSVNTTLSISSHRNQQKIIYDRTVFEDIQNGEVRQSAKWEMWHSKNSRPRKVLGQKTDVMSAIEMIYGVTSETKVKLNPEVQKLTKAETLLKVKEAYSAKNILSSRNYLHLMRINWDSMSSNYSFSIEEEAEIAARLYLMSMCQEAQYLGSKKYLPMLNVGNSKSANLFFEKVMDVSEQQDIAKICSSRPQYPGKDWPYKKLDYNMSEETLNYINSVLISHSSNWQKSIALDLLSRAEDLGQDAKVQDIIIESITLNKLSPQQKLNNFDNFIAKKDINVSYELMEYITQISTELTDREFGRRVDSIEFIFKRINRRNKICEKMMPLNIAFVNRYKEYLEELRYNHSNNVYNGRTKKFSRLEKSLTQSMERCNYNSP